MEQDFPGSREVIRQAFLSRGTPEFALDATLASLTKATIAQYTKPLRLWWYFCGDNRIDCFSPPVSSVLDFLSSSFSSIGSFSTLNTYRAVISLISLDDRLSSAS